MNLYKQVIACMTIIKIEIKRILRIWSQTLLPPAITSILYFIIFGHVIGTRVGEMDGFKYIQFIAPGLIMMNVITSAYASTASSFFGAKFQHSIEEILVSPSSPMTILIGYMLVGMIRGMIVGIIVSVIALLFTHLHVHSITAIVLAGIFSTCIFSLAGLINAIFATSFDDISIIPTFVLTPLIYLGGVFYSISLLPSSWRIVSLANPIVYIIDNFRFGFLGISSGHVLLSFFLMISFIVFLASISYKLIARGVGLRT